MSQKKKYKTKKTRTPPMCAVADNNNDDVHVDDKDIPHHLVEIIIELLRT